MIILSISAALHGVACAAAPETVRFEVSRLSGERGRFVLRRGDQQEIIGQEAYDGRHPAAVAAEPPFSYRINTAYSGIAVLSGAAFCAADLVMQFPYFFAISSAMTSVAFTDVYALSTRLNSRVKTRGDSRLAIAIAIAIGDSIPSELGEFQYFLDQLRRALEDVDRGRFDQSKPRQTVEITRSSI